MHVDYLNITMRQDYREAVRGLLIPVLANLSFFPDSSGVYRNPASSGVVTCNDKYGVTLFTASGGFLEIARSSGALLEFLACFTELPHNVTRLDIAADLPTATPPVLGRFYARAKRGGLSLTNRPIAPDQVSYVKRPSLYGGPDTGTVYFGLKKPQVASLMIYDKRNERLDKGYPDPGLSITRFELKLGRKSGVSLRDVYDPLPVFCHFMAGIYPDLPKSPPAWVRAGEGYSLPPAVPSLPVEALKRSLAASRDMADWLTLADKIGPSGHEYLLSLLARAISDHKTRANAETGLPTPLAQRAIGVGPV